MKWVLIITLLSFDLASYAGESDAESWNNFIKEAKRKGLMSKKSPEQYAFDKRVERISTEWINQIESSPERAGLVFKMPIHNSDSLSEEEIASINIFDYFVGSEEDKKELIRYQVRALMATGYFDQENDPKLGQVEFARAYDVAARVYGLKLALRRNNLKREAGKRISRAPAVIEDSMIIIDTSAR